MRKIVYALFILFFVAFVHTTVLSASPSLFPPSALCELKVPLPALPEINLEIAARGLIKPVHIANAGDGSGRLFIIEQAGLIRILKGDRLLSTPFLDIRERVISGGEMGLLSVAFHPRYSENGRFFVNYTSPAGGRHTVVSEFRVSPGPDVADKATEKILLTVDQPFANHNGGQIAFGPDGFLYIGMGDGGSGNDPFDNGQDLSTLLGKMLRIDVSIRGGDKPYGVPPDNPFIAAPNARPEIWAYGLRNPWRFSFDPPTGFLYAGDVGQNAREEIDIIERGKNYGWRIMEGTICTPGVNPDCDKTGLALPLIDYGRNEGISVTGGFVYRGSEIKPLCGAYLYGDYGSGRIWALRHENERVIQQGLLLDTRLAISSFGMDEAKEVYVADHGGAIYKITAAVSK